MKTTQRLVQFGEIREICGIRGVFALFCVSYVCQTAQTKNATDCTDCTDSKKGGVTLEQFLSNQLGQIRRPNFGIRA
jgi:hypothetical protein